MQIILCYILSFQVNAHVEDHFSQLLLEFSWQFRALTILILIFIETKQVDRHQKKKKKKS